MATFKGLYRTDVRDYPEIAVREAMLNLLVHPDYSFSASALISIYADRIEFVSIGGLMPGIELEDIMVGISVCRNQDLTNVFYRLQLIEAYETGMGRIMRAYADSEEKPTIETTKNAFKIILPNVNFRHERGKNIHVMEMSETPTEERAAEAPHKESGREGLVLAFAAAHGEVTRADVEKLCGVSASTASRLLRAMVGQGYLEQHGKAQNTKYVLAQTQK